MHTLKMRVIIFSFQTLLLLLSPSLSECSVGTNEVHDSLRGFNSGRDIEHTTEAWWHFINLLHPLPKNHKLGLVLFCVFNKFYKRVQLK